jgi:hypothetical protein
MRESNWGAAKEQAIPDPKHQSRKAARALVTTFLFVVMGTSPGDGLQASSVYPRIDGVVRDKTTKEPIAGAVVHLRTLMSDYSAQRGNLAWTTTTGPDGAFTFPAVEHFEYPGAFYLRACKDGYVRYPTLAFGGSRTCAAQEPAPHAAFSSRGAFERALGVFMLGHERKSVVIEMEKAGVLEGTLLARTPSGTKPFAGRVSLYRQIDPEVAHLAVGEVSAGGIEVDSQGAFMFRDVPPSDRYYLMVRSPEFVDERIDGITVRAEESTDVERTLDQTDPTGIRGRITVAGVPAASGFVTIRRQSTAPLGPRDLCGARIRADGSYECRGVRAGRYKLTCKAADANSPLISGERTVQILPGQTISLDIELPWGGM